MQHLPYPRDPKDPLMSVPYVCSKSFDGLDFLGYPKRCYWAVAHALDGSEKLIQHDFFYGQHHTVLEDCYQRWLFFGLLSEVFGTNYRESDFIRAHGVAREIDTSALPDLLNQWIVEAKCWNASRRDETSGRLNRCLDVASTVLSVLNLPHRDDFDKSILMSISALWETIACAIHRAFDTKFLASYPLSMFRLWHGDAFVDRMVASGWCRYDASLVLRRSQSIAELIFLSALKQLPAGDIHAECSAMYCCRTQINMESYRPSHVLNCTCSCLGADPERLAAALENDSFPVLRITGSTIHDIGLEVESFSKDVPFVALSHVWADGLGNPFSQELPRCQLLRLQGLVQSLRGFQRWGSARPEERDLLFWCDTLCVPPDDPNAEIRQQRLRQTAMQKMRVVYEEAAYVLVLDQTLEACAFHKTGVLEAAGRLIISPWMRRLWTYQEIFLANHPLVKFEDCIIDVRNMWQAIQDLASDSVHLDLIRSFQMSLHLLRQRKLYPDQPIFERLLHLSFTLSQRRLSVDSDEAICLCVLLGLDLEKVSSAANEQKMAIFWQLMVLSPLSVTQGLIFNRAKRLKIPGLRWAPSSLLQSADKTLSALLSRYSDERFCTSATADGLRVKFPGWQIEIAQSPHGFDLAMRHHSAFQMEGLTDDKNAILRDANGIWWLAGPARGAVDEFGRGFDHANSANRSLAIVKELDRSDLIYGVFGELAGTVSPIMVTTRSVVTLQRKEENEQRLWNAAFERASDLRRQREQPRLLSILWALWLKEQNQLTTASGPTEQEKQEVFDYSEDYREHVGTIDQCGTDLSRYREFANRVLILYLGNYFEVKRAFGDETLWTID